MLSAIPLPTIFSDVHIQCIKASHKSVLKNSAYLQKTGQKLTHLNFILIMLAQVSYNLLFFSLLKTCILSCLSREFLILIKRT